MQILVTGSIAYDYIMVFPGRFRDHILPDKVHVLSVSFLVDSMKRLRGGTAPNIAYNLALLGERPTVVGTVGEDFAEYQAWLEEHGIDTSGILPVPGVFTASCFINTDLDDNQITAFYSGAMMHAHTVSLQPFSNGRPAYAIIAPNDPQAMERYAHECRELGIPYMYDPSMQAPRMSGEELLNGVRGAQVLIGNDYEFSMMAEKIGCSEPELRDLAPITVVTKGEYGSTIYANGETIEIPAARAHKVVDPTGAGDAYRAGLLKGLIHKVPLEVAGRIASLTACYAVEQMGTQEHCYTKQEFVERYRLNFGGSAELEAIL